MAVMDVLDARLGWYAEIEKAPSRIMAHHHPGVPNLGDVTKVDWSTVEPVDIITGGSPCQDLSHAGKRAGMKAGTRSGLWASMCDAIETLRPRLVMWENVRGAYSAAADSAVEPCPLCVGDGRGVTLRALGRVLGDLAELGYDARWYGLRAADVGAPHGRFRVFVIAAPADANSGGLQGIRRVRPIEHHPDRLDRSGEAPDRVRGTAPADRVTLLPTPAVNDNRDKVQAILDERSRLDDTGCRVWTGWTNDAATPYGRFSVGNQKVYAHRAAYELCHGGIPEGYEIDHVCQNTLCVNPDHLEAVTTEENRARVMQRRTHCIRGHEFTEENTYWVRPGARACRTCRAWQDKVQKARKKGLPEPEPPLLPTPVTNDMSEGKTVEHWDEWTAKMRSAHGNGNGHGKSLAIEEQRLLPTPVADDSRGLPSSGTDYASLPNAVVSLLPTPRATRGGSATETTRLLPTPRATDGTKGGPNQRGSSGDLMLPSAVALLPTPSVADGMGGHLTRSGSRSNELLLPGVAKEIHSANAPCGETRAGHSDIQWGQYDAAIARWEAVLGRPAPSPTEIGAARLNRHGNPSRHPRLSPAFVEWMMGLPAGHVTDPAIGISRNDQLKALGNGVVPQQAAAALRAYLADEAVAP